jgi:hypothetical protein
MERKCDICKTPMGVVTLDSCQDVNWRCIPDEHAVLRPWTPKVLASKTIPSEPPVDIVGEQTSTVDKDANLTISPPTLSLAYPKSDQ